MKKFRSILFISYILVFFTLYSYQEKVSALSSHNWVNVSPTINGIQSYDNNSINTLGKDYITLNSRYSPSNSNESIIYKMKINCSNSTYQDLSVNGLDLKEPVWMSSHGDYLISQVINQSCSSINH